MNALDTALAQIAANGAASAERQARRHADTRLAFLQSVAAQCRAPAPRYGFAGMEDILAYFGSPLALRHRRAAALMRARSGQLGGYRAQVRANLRDAARVRIDEVAARPVALVREAA